LFKCSSKARGKCKEDNRILNNTLTVASREQDIFM